MVFSSVISVERPYQKKGAPACGVYLQAPRKWPIKQAQIQLGRVFAALNASQYERNMHAIEFAFPKAIYEKERMEATAFVALCKNKGVVPIIRNDLGLAVECAAEGLMLDDVADVAQARAVLGERAIIGVDCGNSQASAEAALEASVDYVSFGKFFSSPKAAGKAPIELLEWWSTKTELPAVAYSNNATASMIQLVQSGAGFLGAKTWVWNHDKGPAQAIYMMQECVDYVAANPTTKN
jgi:thiamine-phosphate pyrophosphorylase